MTIFAIMLPGPQPQVAEAIRRLFPLDHYTISETQFLVSASGTAIDVSAKLGVYDPKQPSAPSNGNAVVFATSSYFGRAPATVWDWLKAKLESTPGG